MKEKQRKDFLIRNMPLELHEHLEEAALQHHRSKTQEAIVVLTIGLKSEAYRLKEPKPFKWKKKLRGVFIKKAIEEGRE